MRSAKFLGNAWRVRGARVKCAQDEESIRIGTQDPALERLRE